MSGPLEGVEVLELGSAVAGPFAGKLMADNGANVTRVEPTGGSLMRNRQAWYDVHGSARFTYRFLPYNTGKDSVAVDMKTNAGQRIILKLLSEADVCIENMRTGAMERLGLSWDKLDEEFPELVYCSVSGYGKEGPYSEWPAYDPAIQGVSGWVNVTGDRDSPELTDVIAIDHATAMYATIGILMALIERGMSGEGQRIDVSMFDAAVSFLGHQFAEISASRTFEDIEASFQHIIEPIGLFETADGYLSLLAPPEYWDSFCTAISHEEWNEEGHRFADPKKRLEHREALHESLQDLFEHRRVEEWTSLFASDAPGVVCAPVNDLSDLLDDPHARSRDTVLVQNHPDIGEYLIPGPAIRFSRSETSIGRVPDIGEQTVDVLVALGYDRAHIEELYEQGVIK